MKSGSVFLAISALLAFAGTVQAQQASLTLGDSNAEFCHRHDNAWTLTKTGTLSNSSVTWTVTATKDSSGPAWIQADGYLVVTNTGTAPATIGNIVVNLQKRYKQKWVSAAADVADATSGDAATTANIVAKASQEDPTLNLAHGAGNYTITGARGTFVETAGSGALSFVDASNNTLFSLVPQVSLAPGQSVALLYQAGFNNAVLGLGAGAQVRVEVIVTFGNAGPRGGSGASATNIDINGNGTIDADENWVRSVPTRISRDLPPLEECNNNVLLIDQQSDVAVTGTVAYSNYTSTIPGDGITWLSDSATYTITCDVNGGTNGGTITNTATLTGVTETVTVNGPIDPLTGLPKYSTSFICCLGVNLTASSTLVVPGDDPGPPPGFTPGEFTTFTQGGWGSIPNGNNPGSILANNFGSVYPGGSVEVGIPGTSGYSMTFTSAVAIQNYLPAGKTPNVLNQDLVTPTSSSSGVFGGQVLALQLNVDFSAAGITLGSGGPLGNLYLQNTGSSLDGQTVSQILAAANTALGGGALPDGYTISSLNDLINLLNNAFDGGNPSSWAQTHLSLTAPPPPPPTT